MPAEWNMPLKQSIQWNKVTLLTQVVWLVHVTYFVDNGPKVNWFCVYWTDCPCAFEQGADGEGGGGKFRPHHLKRLYISWFCLFTLDAASLRSSASSLRDFVRFVCCEPMRRSKVHSSSDNHKQNTHIHAHSPGHKTLPTYRDACVPPGSQGLFLPHVHT